MVLKSQLVQGFHFNHFKFEYYGLKDENRVHENECGFSILKYLEVGLPNIYFHTTLTICQNMLE